MTPPALLPLLALAAQAPPVDALSGGSGWAGASLLSAVLAWLLFRHLPAKDLQIRDLLADQRAERERSEARHAAEREQSDARHEAEREEKRVQFERTQAALVDRFTDGLKEIAASLHELKAEVSEMRHQLPDRETRRQR